MILCTGDTVPSILKRARGSVTYKTIPIITFDKNPRRRDTQYEMMISFLKG